MAKRWLRGISPSTGTGSSNAETCAYALLFYYFLRRVLGYQFIEEVVTGGPTRTFENAHDATASDGAFAGSTLTFTSVSNPFSATDVGKFLVLVDSTNEENCGIYPITLYNGPGSVDINFFSSAFPTAATGITWFLLDDGSVSTSKLPWADGDYAVLRVNHASYPYEIKCSYQGAASSPNLCGLVLEFATEANSWDTGTHAWKSTAPVLTKKLKCSKKYYTNTHSRVYAYGRTEGDILFEFTDQIGGAVKNSCVATLLTPHESSPARTARERLIVSGIIDSAGSQWTDRGVESDRDWGHAQHWSEKKWMPLTCYWAGWTLVNSTTDYFTQSLGVNARTGERDGFPIWAFTDPTSAEFLWSPLGELPPAQVFLGTAAGIGDFTTFDSDQYMHVREGVCVPWNGLNQA